MRSSHITDILDLLTSLVDKNLAVSEENDGRTRFGMLETIRHYARDQLKESGEEERVKRRHLECYAAHVEEVLASLRGRNSKRGSIGSRRSTTTCARPWHGAGPRDFAADLRLVGTLAWFWSVRGHLGEVRDCLEKMLSAAPSVPVLSKKYERRVPIVARNITDAQSGALNAKRYLIIDRDTKYSEQFRRLIRDSGTQIIRLPPMSPNLNAYAERFVRSIKEECLDRMIFVGQGSLRHVLWLNTYLIITQNEIIKV